MLFRISELAPEGVWIDEQVKVPTFSWAGGDQVRCDGVALTGEFRQGLRGVEFEGGFSTRVHLHCARCLAELERPLEGKFRLDLVPEAEMEAESSGRGSESETDSDAIDLFPVIGDTIDLVELLQEQVDLALPTRVLCSEECRGLCPACGLNLNSAQCDCTQADDDPGEGLAQLRGILERRKGQDPSGRN